MQPSPLEERIRSLVVERLELALDAAALDPASDLKDDVGLDSAALLEVVVSLEEAFGIAVGVEDVTEDNFRSVAAIAAFIERRQGEAGTAQC
jgi:acyl carrier protein